MKLQNRIAALVAAVALCAGAFAASASADEVSLKIAGQHPIDHFGTEALNQIEADLEAANVGLSVKTFPAGQLGYGEQVFGDVAAGAIDIGHTFIYSHNDPRLEINGLPFMVSTYDQMRSGLLAGLRLLHHLRGAPGRSGGEAAWVSSSRASSAWPRPRRRRTPRRPDPRA